MKLRKHFLLSACFALLGAGAVYAHSGATGIVKERMDAMKDIGKTMKSLGAMAKGEAAFNADTLKAAASSIKGHAGNIDRLFPDTKKSRKSHVTEAAPAIWEQKPEFIALANKMAEAAGGLETISSRSELGGQMKALAATCKGCHEKFRIKKH